MANFEYNPFAEKVELGVVCPVCATRNNIIVAPPSPNFEGETHSESCVNSWAEQECSNCDHVFTVNMASGICGGDGEVEDLEDDKLFYAHEIFTDDQDWEDIPDNVYVSYLSPYVSKIRETVDQIDAISLDAEARNLIYRNLYANVISSMEAYLSDTAIRKIMTTEDYKHKFVELCMCHNDEKFDLSKIYKVYNDLDNIIEKRLRDLIYHKLPVVKNLYKATFDVDLGEVGDLMKAIQIRHHIVHRNGHDTKGNEVNVSKEKLIRIIDMVSDFIENINRQFYDKECGPDVDRVLDEIFGIE